MAEKQLLGRPVWYELLTTDMKGAEDFYTKVVGWTTAAFDTGGHPYHVWNRQGPTGIGGVMTIPPGMNFPPHWEMYVATPSLEPTVAHAERLGGKALSPVIEVPNVGRMRTMTDPDGAVFALFEPSTRGEFEDQQPEPGDVSWRELYTGDAVAAMKFYGELFGWKQRSTFDMGPMGTYYLWGRDWDMGGMMTKPKEMAGVPSAWNIYFRVDNVDSAAERIKANGGQVTNGPMDVPGGDRIVNAIDPQGAHFSLHARK
jgi:predicted enzyme related to lactoylglutathione lyase